MYRQLWKAPSSAARAAQFVELGGGGMRFDFALLFILAVRRAAAAAQAVSRGGSRRGFRSEAEAQAAGRRKSQR